MIKEIDNKKIDSIRNHHIELEKRRKEFFLEEEEDSVRKKIQENYTFQEEVLSKYFFKRIQLSEADDGILEIGLNTENKNHKIKIKINKNEMMNKTLVQLFEQKYKEGLRIHVDKIFNLQRDLDNMVVRNYNLRNGTDIPDIKHFVVNTTLAMMVEYAEFTQEVFMAQPLKKVIEEFVDVLHFMVSLAESLGIEEEAKEILNGFFANHRLYDEMRPTPLFMLVQGGIDLGNFCNTCRTFKFWSGKNIGEKEDMVEAWKRGLQESFWLLQEFHVNVLDIIHGYYKKNKVNIQRQNEGY